ncbi:hypothetical protein JQ596_38565 [Bradyrhizobium manausense]|uniref:hypothetical protein n=1 Tax=Bradyrhizobium manausense TaxID=989370 RepID=UPI001BA76E68|nr:hypothetical protein [Bradyrhizobium manausense]MBR0831425.1 hypothetical protein [Bradyrhizobium manausense]
MTGFQAKLERFESLASECELIARRADGSKRELYLRLGERYRDRVNDMRALIASFDIAA